MEKKQLELTFALIWLQKHEGHWKLHIDGELIMETTEDKGPGRFSEPHSAVFNKGKAHFRYYKYYKPANKRIIKKRIGLTSDELQFLPTG